MALPGTGKMRHTAAVSAILLFALGCHGDTDQGGAPARGNRAGTTTTPAARQSQTPVPTPPTADQVDPSSPRAVLGGTSTTQTGNQPSSGATQPPPPAPH